jgi:ElaA protein
VSARADLAWRWCRFDDLGVRELQNIFAARQRVFAIEQQCIYLDVDGCDESAWHLAAWSPVQREPLAYARVLDPGVKYPEASIGRVITVGAGRGIGLGRELVARAIAGAPRSGRAARSASRRRRGSSASTKSSASSRSARPYLEDGIDHTEMLRTPPA